MMMMMMMMTRTAKTITTKTTTNIKTKTKAKQTVTSGVVSLIKFFVFTWCRQGLHPNTVTID